MRTVHVLALAAAAVVHLGSLAEARAQAARRGHYYNRTATVGGRAGVGVERGVGTFGLASAPSAGDFDPLRPYSSRPAAYSSEPVPARPTPRPAPRSVSRNYYPTARFGQSPNRNRPSSHCTPSRGGMLGR